MIVGYRKDERKKVNKMKFSFNFTLKKMKVDFFSVYFRTRKIHFYAYILETDEV